MSLVFLLVLFCTPNAVCQQSYFSTYPVWSSGPTFTTRGVALGDVDGDGDLDLVCANDNESNTLYLADGGVFQTTPVWAPGSIPYGRGVALGDVDGDGDLDLVCGYYNRSNTLYLNDGGVFQTTPVWYSESANSTESVALGDVDGDGDLDLVCGNFAQGNTLYLNDGGMFQSTPIWSSEPANQTWRIALGDVDGNGDLDLVCGNLHEANTLYLNDGDVFQTTPVWSSGPANTTWSVALGDVDGDGDLDLVCGNDGQNNTLYLADAGTFQSTPVWSSGSITLTTSVALGDVDGDGDLDLVCGNDNLGNSLYLNDGGMLQTTPVWSSGAANSTFIVALGDVDGDGDLDLVCGNLIESNTLYRADGGMFQSTPDWTSVPASQTMGVALGDVDRDGDLDLVCGNDGQNNTLYLADAGTFQSTPDWTSGPIYRTASVALGDVDGDGDLDFVCGNDGQSNTLYLCDGGVFQTTPVWTSGPANSTLSLALGDVDWDGDLDLVCGNDNQSNTLYLNDSGVFQTTPVWSSGPAYWTESVTLGDVNGDGDLDLVCGNYPEGNTLYLNDGGVFQSEPVWTSGRDYWTFAVALGDVDGDEDLDLVCGNYAESNTLYLNDGGVFQTPPVWTSGPTYWTWGVALGDVDGDGDLDLACGNVRNNTLYVNDGGVFQPLPAWSSGRRDSTRSVALGDIDGDGDLDLVCGNDRGSNTLIRGVRSPVFKGDPLAPANHLPNNAAHLRFVDAEQQSSVSYRVHFTAIDVESDPVWLLLEYQYRGDPTRYHGEIGGQSGKIGPFATTPDGVRDSIDWDTYLLPFDSRDVILRLRTISVPKRVSIIQHNASYLKEIDPVEPYRPVIATSTNSLSFSTITVGDTTSLNLVITNSGNAVLSIIDIELPSSEMRHNRSIPFEPFYLEPGERDTLTFFLEPRYELNIAGDVLLFSNDPINAVETVSVISDIRALEIESRLLTPVPAVPLGEALTVIVTPAPQVRVEKGFLYHRPSVTAAAFLDSIPLTRSANDFIAVIPGDYVVEGGIDYYIEVENSGVFETDPPGAPDDSVFYQEVAAPLSVTSLALPNEGTSFVEGRDIRVQVELPDGAEFVAGTLFYRPGGGTDYENTALEMGELLPLATIPDTVSGARGLEFYIEVQTRTTTLSDPPVNPDEFPKSIPVTVLNLADLSAYAGEVHRMLSIPLDMEGTILGAVGDDIGGQDNTQWRMFTYLTGQAGYVEIPNDEIFAFEQGRSYWLITRETHWIDTGPARGVSAPTDSFYSMALEPGWNMIGDPFAFNIAWDSCLVDTLGGDLLTMTEADGVVVERPVMWLVGFGYKYDMNRIDPFTGYWVRCLHDATIILKVQPREAPPTVPPLEIVSGEDTPDKNVEWLLAISATAADAGDHSNVAGVVPEAMSTRDRFDRFEAPMAPGRSVSLYFPHLDWVSHPGNYTYDIRGRYEALDSDALRAVSLEGDLWGHIWRFDVAKNFTDGNAGDKVVLEFTGFESMPVDAVVYLIDRSLERLIDIRIERTYRFLLGKRGYVSREEDARFILLVGSEEFIEEHEDELPKPPVETSLYQNYPNPFNPSTVIRFDIAIAGDIELKIYDARGLLVRTLMQEYRAPGRYEVGWDGENDNGSKVSSGIYFYRLNTNHRTQTRKMILIR